MNYYVFQVSDQSKYGKQKSAQEIFNFLVKERNVWGFGHRTANRKSIKEGDKVIFYITGTNNQYFIGYATLSSGAYEDESASDTWLIDEETLRIDLKDVNVFSNPKPRKDFTNLEWQPAQGGSSRISENDYNLIVGSPGPSVSNSFSSEEDQVEFVLEKYLEEFIVSNWEKIDFGEKLTLFEDDDGNFGQQYYAEEVGYIDILAQDKNKNFVVIELKKGRKNDEVIGQVLRYIGWVRKHLAKNNQKVRGVIIVGERDKKLEYALEEISNKVEVFLYSVNFRLNKY